MRKIQLGKSEFKVGEIALGCMRMDRLSKDYVAQIIHNALDAGVELFDHADIYGGGGSEEIFAESIDMKSLREKMIIQTKCGIRNGYFDFSKEHILQSVDGSLRRLQTDYIDILLLHRPDALVEPEEVAEAFSELKESGKVRHFGVSNQNPMQIELLKKYVEVELIVNQMQLSLMHTPMIDAGLNVNMHNEASTDRDNGTIEYCRLNEITIQTWSPFQFGLLKGPFIDNEDYPVLNAKLKEYADKFGVTTSAIAVAWILRHPARMQPIIGTMNTERLREIAKAADIRLTREEWYDLYRAAGNELP
ncbi:MAG: aldo/keto reductase [Bacillus sp. (in: Bacteria)]|nr:aldo/keto reductase [Bacillus sp. (in: firmicutes)]